MRTKTETVKTLKVLQVSNEVIIDNRIAMQLTELIKTDCNGVESKEFEFAYHKASGVSCVEYCNNYETAKEYFINTLRTIDANYKLSKIDTNVKSFKGFGSKRYYTA